MLSDIHAMSRELQKLNSYSGISGSTHFAEDRDRIQNRVLAIGDVLKDRIGEIDAIFVLGDLAHQAKELVISQVWNDVHLLAAELDVPNVIGLIGNHDIYSRASTLQEAEQLRDYLRKLTPSFPLSDEETNKDYFASGVAHFPISGCRVIILNTCELHGIGSNEASVKALFDKGNVSSAMIEKVSDIFKNATESHFIVAMHHHPRKLNVQADKYNDAMERGETLLREVETRGKPTLVLHGHKHLVAMSNVSNSVGSPLVFSAASLAAEPYYGQANFFSNQFHMFEVDLDETSKPKGKIYSWDWGDPHWDESTRPHMPFERPFGMKADFVAIAKNLETLPNKVMYREEELEKLIPELALCSVNDINYIDQQLSGTPKKIVMNNGRLCLIYEEG